jgi:hypothetical protein
MPLPEDGDVTRLELLHTVDDAVGSPASRGT